MIMLVNEFGDSVRGEGLVVRPNVVNGRCLMKKRGSPGRLHQAAYASARWSTGLWNPLIDTGPTRGGRASAVS